MRLTAFTDYTLRVLIYLACTPERRVTTAEIGAAFGINENHLTKVVNASSRNGWVEAVRGKGGGLRLAMPADEIGVGDVIRAAEGATVAAECFETDGGHCAIDRSCRLKGVLAEAVSAFHAVLDGYTLADLAQNRRALTGILLRRDP